MRGISGHFLGGEKKKRRLSYCEFAELTVHLIKEKEKNNTRREMSNAIRGCRLKICIRNMFERVSVARSAVLPHD